MVTAKNLKYTHAKYCNIEKPEKPEKIKKVVEKIIKPKPNFKYLQPLDKTTKPLETLRNQIKYDTEEYIQSRILQDRNENKINIEEQNKINRENIKIKNIELRANAISKLLINAF